MPRARLAAVVVVEAAAVVALHRLGAGLDWTWDGSPERAIEALATAGALAVGYWVALSGIAYTVAAGLRCRPGLDVVGALTAAPVRRLVGRALGVSMAVASVAAPAVAADELPPALAHLAHSGDSHVVQPGESGGTYRVQPDDNLWDIAENRLAAAVPDPTQAEVAAYWLQVIAANRETLQSGDPDLIYPGETVLLPPPRG